MDVYGKLKPGMRIIGPDDREYGTIERFDDENVYVAGRKVPHGAFERLDKDRLYVSQSGSRYFVADRAAGAMGTEDAIRVPLVEERLDVSKRQVKLGEVEVRKTVESEQVSIPVELMHEDVQVHRVDVAERPASEAEIADGFWEGTIRIPVREEKAVIRKEAMVTGEVVIDRERVAERETVTDTVRRERVTVHEDYDADRATVRTDARTLRGSEATSDRTVEVDRPVARRDAEAGGTRSGESWDELREEIREASEHSRR
jgi:uncharacterized protein (TIGR02271 family)